MMIFGFAISSSCMLFSEMQKEEMSHKNDSIRTISKSSKACVNINVFQPISFESNGAVLSGEATFESTCRCTLKKATAVEYPDEITFPKTILYKDTEYNLVSIGDFSSLPVKKLSIHNKIISISPAAFKGCSYLKVVNIEENSKINTIDEETFSGTALTKFNFSDSVNKIQSRIFDSCSNLNTIYLPAKMNIISPNAFSGISSDSLMFIIKPTQSTISTYEYCTSLVGKLIILEGIDKIDRNCFSKTGITSLMLPETLSYIDSYSFSSCSALTGLVKIPYNVKTVNPYSFNGCNLLTEVHYCGVSNIAGFVFGTTHSIKQVSVTAGYPGNEFGRVSIVRDLSEAKCKATPVEPKCEFVDYHQVNINSNGVEISVEATFDIFCNCAIRKDSRFTYPSSVEFPAEVIDQFTYTINTIGDFSGITTIEQIKLSNKVSTVSPAAFKGCSNLASVNINDCVLLDTIDEETFSGTALTEFNFSDSVNKIGSLIFENCTKLKKISLPSLINSIEPNAFKGCSSIKEFIIRSTYPYVSGYRGCYSLTGSLIIEDGITSISPYCFSRTYIKNVTFPYTLVNISKGAFSYTPLVGPIHIPYSVTLVDLYAFQDCTSIIEFFYCGVTVNDEFVFNNRSSSPSLKQVIVNKKYSWKKFGKVNVVKALDDFCVVDYDIYLPYDPDNIKNMEYKKKITISVSVTAGCVVVLVVAMVILWNRYFLSFFEKKEKHIKKSKHFEKENEVHVEDACEDPEAAEVGEE